MEDTIFGKITRGEIPTDFIYQDEQCVVIKDIYPQAPTHVLIIPRKPIPMLAAADEVTSHFWVTCLSLREKWQSNWVWMTLFVLSSTMVRAVGKPFSIFIYTSSRDAT